MKSYFRHAMRNLLIGHFRRKLSDRPFCIFSNDCWGGELYKYLDRPYNTPFIGLMLMGPCYVELLSAPKEYLQLPLNFKTTSKYPDMRALGSGTKFPLATLGDTSIEIHFLHYRSTQEADEKWTRRVARIDWNNLFVKYDCGKDHSTSSEARRFLSLNFKHKLIFGADNFGQKEVLLTTRYSTDALIQFKNGLLYFDPFTWLRGDAQFRNRFQKSLARLASKYL